MAQGLGKILVVCRHGGYIGLGREKLLAIAHCRRMKSGTYFDRETALVFRASARLRAYEMGSARRSAEENRQQWA